MISVADPPHSPAQSMSAVQLPLQSWFSAAYAQSPSAPKLHADSSSHVGTGASYAISRHPLTEASNADPAGPDTIKSLTQGASPVYVNVVNTPSPADINDPVREKPITEPLLPADTIKPAAVAAPPEAPVKLEPVLNWNP